MIFQVEVKKPTESLLYFFINFFMYLAKIVTMLKVVFLSAKTFKKYAKRASNTHWGIIEYFVRKYILIFVPKK